ncbi:MAG: DSD1 family PLP-dependent enzyme [candidate division NC10 bacterium]|nr:DSD1 family PLP-dependent enzyme [candidate division NC10 bacterium]
MSMIRPPLGIDLHDIDTPALLIDLDVMERNLQTMADFFKDKPAKLRPHVKTHKTPLIAHKQIALGAIGMTCAKAGEAEIMVWGGVKDVLIANQVVGREKIQRVVCLARHATVTVAVDDPVNVHELSQAAEATGAEVGVLVEVNVGMNRCGVEPAEPALHLAKEVLAAKGLKFRGLMGYEGHLVFKEKFAEREAACQRDIGRLIDTKGLLEQSGLLVEIVSSGGTGTAMITGMIPGITEIQAGSYVFMDGRYKSIEGVGERFDCALTLLTQVVSRPSPTLIVVDAGMKAITHEFGYPTVVGHEDMKVVSLSEEHGKIQLADPSVRIRSGDKLRLLPSHGDTTINIHDMYFGVRRGTLEQVWEIAARGKFV